MAAPLLAAPTVAVPRGPPSPRHNLGPLVGGPRSLPTHSDKPDQELFVTPPSESLICPIHLGLFDDPFIARCGHTFCHSCITENLSHNQQCPLDKTPLSAEHLIPNLALKGQISDLVCYCMYGFKRAPNWQELSPDQQWVKDENGCTQRVKYGLRDTHHKECEHRPTACPNSAKCGKISMKYLAQHVASCTNVPCANNKLGCTTVGTAEEMERHRVECKYESMKDVLGHNQQQFETLQKQIASKDGQIASLVAMVQELSQKLENLADNIEVKLCNYDQTLEKMAIQMNDTRRQVIEAMDEINMVKQRATASDDMSKVYPHVFTCKGTIAGHAGPIWAIEHFGNYLFSGSSDMTIKVWDMDTYQNVKTLEGHEGIVQSLAKHGRHLFSGASDSTIRVWDLEDNFRHLHTIKAHENTVCTVAVATKCLLSCSLKEIKVWDLENFECTHILTGHNHWVRALAVAGTRLYSGSYNMIKVWDLDNYQCVQTISGHDGSVYSLCVQGNFLISGTYENNVQVWDLTSMQCRQTLTGHIGTVYAVTVHGGKLFSGSYDNTVKVWSLENFQCLQTLVRHTSSVDALRWAKGRLFSGGADNTIKIWQ